ncbi:unnamed protein product, partial [Closterium sp. Naga37s-1]
RVTDTEPPAARLTKCRDAHIHMPAPSSIPPELLLSSHSSLSSHSAIRAAQLPSFRAWAGMQAGVASPLALPTHALHSLSSFLPVWA